MGNTWAAARARNSFAVDWKALLQNGEPYIALAAGGGKGCICCRLAWRPRKSNPLLFCGGEARMLMFVKSVRRSWVQYRLKCRSINGMRP